MKFNEFKEQYQSFQGPVGWIITYNTFFDIEPPFNDPTSKNWYYFKELLLQALYIKTKKNPRNVLHLGWYPECDPKGRFIIKVFKAAFPYEQLFEFESRSKQEIVDMMEKIFIEVAEGKMR